MSARGIDVHALPAMLTALRLPSFHRHWPSLAERADKEGWQGGLARRPLPRRPRRDRTRRARDTPHPAPSP